MFSNMLEGALDLPSFQKHRKTFYNFRAAAVRKKYEEEIERTLAMMREDELEKAESKFTTEYRATVGAKGFSTPKAWQEQASSALIERYPLHEETITWWKMQSRGIRSGFKRNSYFTTPVEENIRNYPEQVCRLTMPMKAYEIYNRDFPSGELPHWFHPIPSADGVVQILRDLT